MDKSLVRSFRRKKSRGGNKRQLLEEGSKVPPKRLEDLVPGKRSKDWFVQKQPGKQEGRTYTRDALERYSIVSYEHASRRLRLDIMLKFCKEEHGMLL